MASYPLFWREVTRGRLIYSRQVSCPQVAQEWALLHFLAVKHSNLVCYRIRKEECKAKLLLVLKWYFCISTQEEEYFVIEEGIVNIYC